MEYPCQYHPEIILGGRKGVCQECAYEFLVRYGIMSPRPPPKRVEPEPELELEVIDDAEFVELDDLYNEPVTLKQNASMEEAMNGLDEMFGPPTGKPRWGP